MEFDRWFNKQSVLIKVLLLIIPVVGWIVEFLVRLSVLLRTKKVEHLIMFILFTFVGWGWILNVIDIVYMCLSGHLILAE